MPLRSRSRSGSRSRKKERVGEAASPAVVSERYGSQASTEGTFDLSGTELRKTLKGNPKGARSLGWLAWLELFFRDVFLPQGYPESVTADYVPYQIWDTVQAFASSLTGALATEAVLRGAGVGDASASALATALTWLLKDGAGMLGRILFAYARGSALDADCKKWRLVADILNDAAFLLDLLAPAGGRALFPYVVCCSSVLRSLVGVAGGATRAALTQHQARRNNLADVSAKDGSQETLVNLTALVCSFFLLQAVAGKFLLVWVLFVAFTALHLYANYRAVRCLSLDTLNGARMRIVARGFIASGKVVSPASANASEPILRSIVGLWEEPAVRYGVSLAAFGEVASLRALLRDAAGRKYLLRAQDGAVVVALAEGGGVEDLLEAALAAEHLAYHKARPKTPQEASAWAKDKAAAFVGGLSKAGWTTAFTLLNPDEWRYRF